MEVARRCSVSKSTVSRVLNGSKHGRFSVSPAVREKILKVARELNYRPNIAARNLTISKTHLVAVLGLNGFWSDRVGPIDEAAAALARVLDGAGYEIYVQFMTPRHNPFDLPPLRVDGIVAVSPQSLDDLAALEKSEVPYVSLDGVVGKRGARVYPDDAEGTYKALQHLVDLGHRRIAYLDNPSIDATHLSVTVRRDSFTRASKEMNFEVPKLGLPKLQPEVSWDLYYEPFLRRAVLEEKATAVLSYSHHGALAVLRIAHDLHLSVPRDFSLICFNDVHMLNVSVPSLTAIDVPAIPLGHTAAELLLQQMTSDDPLTSRSIKLKESLIIRESTAVPGHKPH
jgi:DNA-binding LacI/PurR family transcriptional regulator